MIDLYDFDDWVKVRMRSPDKGGKPPRFQHSKLFMGKNARRGSGMKTEVPDSAPMFVFRMGHTQRQGIGADSRTIHRDRLRSQAYYNGRDGKLGWAFSFDKNGQVEKVWERVEEWEDDKRYFRASLNPAHSEKITDWQRFGTEFMEAFQHGSAHTFDKDGKGLHWHTDGLLTDDDRAAGHELDWVMSIHRETGRTHAHVLIRGMVGSDYLYIEPGAAKQLWKIGRGVASMDHHIGLRHEYSIEQDRQFSVSIDKEMNIDHPAVRRKMGLGLGSDDASSVSDESKPGAIVSPRRRILDRDLDL